MPSITTHYIQSEEVYKKLNKEEKEHIKDNKTIFNIFTQSHDILFYSIFIIIIKTDTNRRLLKKTGKVD